MNYRLDNGLGRGRILLIEPREPLRELLATAFQSRGFHVIQTSDGAHADVAWACTIPETAAEVRRLRKRHPNVPIVRAAPNDQPVSNGTLRFPTTLLEMERALLHALRVTTRDLPFDDRHGYGMDSGCLDVLLRPKERGIVEDIMACQGAVATRAYLEERAFGAVVSGDSGRSPLDQHVSQSRPKLWPFAIEIENVRGTGYRALAMLGAPAGGSRVGIRSR